MTKIVLAGLAVAVIAPGAAAEPRVCVSLADPRGDQATPQGRVPTPDATDLLGVEAGATEDAVTVVFRVAGAPAPAPGQTYHYGLRFGDANAEYEMSATLTGADLHSPTRSTFEMFVDPVDPPPTVSAAGRDVWLADRLTIPITGAVDLAANQVRVTAPAAAFGVAGFEQGRTWTVWYADTGAGAIHAFYGPLDVADAGEVPLVAGHGRCT